MPLNPKHWAFKLHHAIFLCGHLPRWVREFFFHLAKNVFREVEGLQIPRSSRLLHSSLTHLFELSKGNSSAVQLNLPGLGFTEANVFCFPLIVTPLSICTSFALIGNCFSFGFTAQQYVITSTHELDAETIHTWEILGGLHKHHWKQWKVNNSSRSALRNEIYNHANILAAWGFWASSVFSCQGTSNFPSI